MPFIIAPLSDVKGLNDYPEYQAALKATQDAAFHRAGKVWNGYTPGGLIPGDKQFGVGPLRKNDMSRDTSDSTPSGSYTFRTNIAATGWRDIFSYTVRADTIHGFVGFLVAEDALRITQFRMEIGQNRFPIWDLQEAQRYNRFAIIIKTDAGKELVADEKSRVLWRIYVESTGFQRVVPLGLQLFKNPDLVLTET